LRRANLLALVETAAKTLGDYLISVSDSPFPRPRWEEHTKQKDTLRPSKDYSTKRKRSKNAIYSSFHGEMGARGPLFCNEGLAFRTNH
jgi:hypothetical protein